MCMRRLKSNIKALNINHKIELAMAILLIGTTVFTMFILSLMARNSLEKKSLELAAQQINTASHNTTQMLESVYNISNEIVGNSWVQAYLRAHGTESDYTLTGRSANEVLDNQRDSNNMLRFISIQKTNSTRLLYTGTTWTIPDFSARMQELYAQSQVFGLANMRYTLAPDIFTPDTYSFYFFMPVYNRFNVGEELGMLYICVAEKDIRSVYSARAGEALFTYLAADNGYLLSGDAPGLIGQATLLDVAVASNSGVQQPLKSDSLLIYHRLANTGWYMVGEITRSYLMEDFKQLVPLAFMVLVICVILSVVIMHMLSRSIYRPLQAVINRMDTVAGGNLQVQLPAANIGNDLMRLYTSFNTMVRQIQRLMDQVKAEQYEADKTKFNMLQSQIQPHFLYNVLDSIHWQAAYNYDKEVCSMVQKLANYYRLSLSKGNDIIPLQQELAMVQHYLDLQNLRYDNLVDFEVDLPEGLAKLAIPKLTLQPLVENAIYHGFRASNIKHGHIKLSALLKGQDVLLLMEDDGGGGSDAEVLALNKKLQQHDPAAGYGLQNVHKRFELYFGVGYGLHIERNNGKGLRITLKLPGSGDTTLEKEGE